MKTSPKGISICDLDMPSLKSGDPVRIVAIYSASSMHAAVLYGQACVKNGIQTYGYEDARGGASASFRDQLARDRTRVNVVEYEIDVGGVIERDEDGEWLKAKTVYSWRAKSGTEAVKEPLINSEVPAGHGWPATHQSRK